MFDGRNNLAHEVEKQVRGHFGQKVFESVIPRNVKLSECSSFGKPVVLYDVDSKGCVAYLNLAKEILSKSQTEHTGIPVRLDAETREDFTQNAITKGEV